MVLGLGLWLGDHPEWTGHANDPAPPALTVLAVANFFLALVVLPFTVGAAVAWWRHARERGESASASAWAAVLAEWA